VFHTIWTGCCERGPSVRPCGFSFIEVLVATALLMVGVTALAQLFVLAGDANRLAAETTAAVFAAVQKTEQLRVNPTAAGLSPAGTLWRNAAGWFDLLDAHGEAVGDASAAIYIRRWSADQISGLSAVVLQVRVVPRGKAWQPPSLGVDGRRVPGEVRTVVLRRLSGT
jgi:hypothetical protein